MKIVSIEDLSHERRRALGKYAFKKDFTAGWQMTDFMLSLSRKCEKINDDSIIYWHSNHHQILLWIDQEREKYLTLLLI
jgi:hypothetical protein